MAVAAPQIVSVSSDVVPVEQLADSAAQFESAEEGGQFSEDSFDASDFQEAKPNKPNWSIVEESVSIWQGSAAAQSFQRGNIHNFI